MFYDVQAATYSNMETFNADADERRHGDGDATTYDNIQPSPTSAAAEPQYSNSVAAQRHV